MNRYPCDAYVDIGPFRFECSGHTSANHIGNLRRSGVRKVVHHAISPGDIGDVDVTFWTPLPEGDDDGN